MSKVARVFLWLFVVPTVLIGVPGLIIFLSRVSVDLSVTVR
jgi:hypothetical protein